MRRTILYIVLVFMVLPSVAGSDSLRHGVPQYKGRAQNVSLSQKWEAKLSWGMSMGSRPVVVDGVIYVTMADCVCAIDAATGKVKWRRPSEGQYAPSPVLWNGLVLSSGGGRAIEALDASTGAFKWAYVIRDVRDNSYSAPLVADGIVYFSSGWSEWASHNSGWGGHITALDATNGEVIWQKEMSGSQSGGGLAIADGTLYFGNGNEHKYNSDALHAVDAKTGAEKWVVQTSYDLGDIFIFGNVLYVASRERLVAIDATNGKELWKREGGDKLLSDPALGDGKLYFVEMDYQFCFEGCKDPVGSHPDHLLTVDAKTGEERMRVDIGDIDPNRIVLLDGVLYYHVSNIFSPRELHAVDPATGDLMWKFEADEPLWGDPAVADGIVYVGEDDGTLHALHMPSRGTPSPARQLSYIGISL